MLRYTRVCDGDKFVNVDDFRPFKAIVVIEDGISNEWRWRASKWLVESGCLYMMAWGKDCSAWDDSVDWANLKAFDFAEIPVHQFVMTTWHDDESLADVFHFAKYSADHPSIELENILVFHIGKNDRKTEFEAAYFNT